jgi:hypothetical protein
MTDIAAAKKNFFTQNTEEHPFHLVNSSLWPMSLALSLYNLFIILIGYFNYFHVASFTLDLVT